MMLFFNTTKDIEPEHAIGVLLDQDFDVEFERDISKWCVRVPKHNVIVREQTLKAAYISAAKEIILKRAIKINTTVCLVVSGIGLAMLLLNTIVLLNLK